MAVLRPHPPPPLPSHPSRYTGVSYRTLSKIFDVLSYRNSKFEVEPGVDGPIPPPPPLDGRHLKVKPKYASEGPGRAGMGNDEASRRGVNGGRRTVTEAHGRGPPLRKLSQGSNPMSQVAQQAEKERERERRSQTTSRNKTRPLSPALSGDNVSSGARTTGTPTNKGANAKGSAKGSVGAGARIGPQQGGSTPRPTTAELDDPSRSPGGKQALPFEFEVGRHQQRSIGI